MALWLIAQGAFLWKRANHADQGAKGEEDIAQAIAHLCVQTRTNKIFESVAKQHFQKFYCGSFDRKLL